MQKSHRVRGSQAANKMKSRISRRHVRREIHPARSGVSQASKVGRGAERNETPSLKKGYALFQMNHKKNFLCSERRRGLQKPTTSSVTPSTTPADSGYTDQKNTRPTWNVKFSRYSISTATPPAEDQRPADRRRAARRADTAVSATVPPMTSSPIAARNREGKRQKPVPAGAQSRCRADSRPIAAKSTGTKITGFGRRNQSGRTIITYSSADRRPRA